MTQKQEIEKLKKQLENADRLIDAVDNYIFARHQDELELLEIITAYKREARNIKNPRLDEKDFKKMVGGK